MINKEVPLADNLADRVPQLAPQTPEAAQPEEVDARVAAIDDLRQRDPFLANAAEIANNRRKNGVNLKSSRIRAMDKAQEFSLKLARVSAEKTIDQQPPIQPPEKV